MDKFNIIRIKMKVILKIKHFWLDFFASYYKRLKKNANYEEPISVVMHISFCQSLNINTLLLPFLHFLFKVEFTFSLIATPIIAAIIINMYYFYIVLNNTTRNSLLNRKSKYTIFVYDIYFFLSTILFGLAIYITSI